MASNFTQFEAIVVASCMMENQHPLQREIIRFAESCHITPDAVADVSYLVVGYGGDGLDRVLDDLPKRTFFSGHSVPESSVNKIHSIWYRKERTRANAVFASLVYANQTISSQISCWILQRRVLYRP